MATPGKNAPRTLCLLSQDPLLVSSFQEMAYLRGFQFRLANSMTAQDGAVPELPVANLYVIDTQVLGVDLAGSVAEIVSKNPACKVLVVGEEFRPQLSYPLLSMGVRGLLLRSRIKMELANAVEAVAAGGFWVPRTLLSGFVDSVIGSVRRTKFALGMAELDDTESKLLDAVLKNVPDEEIARTVELNGDEIPQRVSGLLKKFGVRRRADLILLSFSDPTSNVA